MWPTRGAPLARLARVAVTVIPVVQIMNYSAQKQTEIEASNAELRIAVLESQMNDVLERNRRVERNKTWETSRTRLVAVTATTYITMILVFAVLGSRRPMLDALVPTAGFFLSTLSLPMVRRIWEKRASKGPR